MFRYQYSPAASKSIKSVPSVCLLSKHFDLLRYGSHSPSYQDPFFWEFKSHQLRIFRSCASSANNTQTALFSPTAKSVRHLTRCFPPNMTGEKGKVGSSSCATGALRLGADCEMAVKFYLNRSTGSKPLSSVLTLTKLYFCASNETAIRTKTDEVAGTLDMEKLTGA